MYGGGISRFRARVASCSRITRTTRHSASRRPRAAPSTSLPSRRCRSPTDDRDRLLLRDDLPRRPAAGLVADLAERLLGQRLAVVDAAEDHERVGAEGL